MTYRIKPSNSRPLDSSSFHQRTKLDIYDIPISKITKEFWNISIFQGSVEICRRLHRDGMELMLSVRMLLPKVTGEVEEEDPRAELSAASSNTNGLGSERRPPAARTRADEALLPPGLPFDPRKSQSTIRKRA
jgi:chromatin segregation and condensation protein Rec8/ScpA/Scc1 (kleisin family)